MSRFIFFALFPKIKKCEELTADFISSTPSACEEPHFSEDGNFSHEDDKKTWMPLSSGWWYLLCSEPGEYRVDPRVDMGRGCFFMVLVASVVLASAYSLWSTSYPDDHGSFWETGTGPRHASAYGCFSKNFLSFVLALFALGIWCIISIDLVPGSHCSLRLVLLRSTENWISREMSISVGAMLGSTLDTCYASVFWGYGRIAHIFYVAAGSNTEVLLSLLLKEEACPVDASGCSFALRSSHLEYWKCFSSFTWLTRVMMGSIFRRSVRHFSASSLELRPWSANSFQRLVVKDIPTDDATKTPTHQPTNPPTHQPTKGSRDAVHGKGSRDRLEDTGPHG